MPDCLRITAHGQSQGPFATHESRYIIRHGLGLPPVSLLNLSRKIIDGAQSSGGNTEAQDDRTLVVLERIKIARFNPES
jgi:hypothetical protein